MSRFDLKSFSGGALASLLAMGAIGSSPADAVAISNPNNVLTYSVLSTVPISNAVAYVSQGGDQDLIFAPGTIPANTPVQFNLNSTKAAAVDRTLALGLTTSHSGDVTTNHLILGTNVGFGTNAIGKDFSSLFPSYSEDTLISDLLTLSGGSGATGYTTAFSDVLGFGNYAGTLASDPAFKPPSDIDLLSFSQAQLVGTGTVTQSIAAPVAAVPEPATWALMLVGFAGVGGALRRKRSEGALATA